jgi:ribonucleoside-diphosphate reductase alpha chain
MYKREQVYKEALEYFNGDELAANVWIDKYSLKEPIPDTDDFKFHELSPTDMHWRLAKEFARIEKKYPNPMSVEEIFELIKDFKYIVPQGSPMAGIGNDFAISSISNCLVIGDHPDSYGGILAADEEQAQLMKRRCGVGNSMDVFRPSGAIAGASPLGPNAGAPLYMERFSNTTREVQQDGRRGALMLAMDARHPDIDKFIDKKMEQGKVTGANVSVKLRNEFIEMVEQGKDFWQTHPVQFSIEQVTGTLEYDKDFVEYDKLYQGEVIDGIQTYYKKVRPEKIWERIIHNAWASAEPGILFWDQILNESPARGYGEAWRETATNPCGEIPLPPNDSCRLLLINLYSYAYNGFSKKSFLEDKLLENHVKKAMRLMDNIVDLEIEKIDKILEDIETKIHNERFQKVEKDLWLKIRKKAVDGRRTGFGITGEGDLIAALGMTYGTPEATKFSETLHRYIATTAYEASIELAEERGAFPIYNFEADQESDFIKRMFSPENNFLSNDMIERYKKFGRRNIALLTIAPAGSVSILTQTTSGVEPVFSPWHFRKRKILGGKDTKFDYVDEMGDKWVEFPIFHKPFIDWYSITEMLTFEEARTDLQKMNKEELKAQFERSPYFKATSEDVDYVEKVRMQGAIQKWVDHSISVTVNMPEHVTEKMVADVYKEAHSSGCKGVTVYRDNSRGNVLSTTSVKDTPKSSEEDFSDVAAAKRPERLECDIFHKSSRGNPFIFIVGKLNGRPYEIFGIPNNDETKFSKSIKSGTITKITKKGSSKYILKDEKENILVENVTLNMIENEQNSTRAVSALLRHRVGLEFIVHDIIYKYATISSFHKVMGKVLESYIENKKGNPCPVCSTEMQMTEGCMKCPSCGHAACG